MTDNNEDIVALARRALLMLEAAQELDRLRKVIVAVAIEGRVSRKRVGYLLAAHGCFTTIGDDESE